MLIPKYNNTVELSGALSIVVFDTELQTVKQELFIPNLVVTTGKVFIASRMIGTSATVMSHMGIGTGFSSDTDAAQTALGAELTVAGGYTGYTRAAVTATSNANVVTYSANFAANNPSAPTSTGAGLREAGIFNASTAGTMLCRTVFPIVTKMPADALTITWTITVS